MNFVAKDTEIFMHREIFDNSNDLELKVPSKKKVMQLLLIKLFLLEQKK